MASSRWADDGGLLAELGRALREADEVPAELFAAGRAAWTWRTVEAELAVAELLFDSACDAEPAGLTRSGRSARTLAFRSGDVSVEIEVTEAGIAGQIGPGNPGRVSGQTATGTFDEAPVDQAGFFTLGSPPPGPVRLRFAQPPAVATSWVSLG